MAEKELPVREPWGPRGIKAFFFKRMGHVPITKEAQCDICHEKGIFRYFIAVKLPKITPLCDEDYRLLRKLLEDYLQGILRNPEAFLKLRIDMRRRGRELRD